MSSLHPSAEAIIKSGIFNKLNSFNELKKRISKTKSLNNRDVQNTKGDIFEIFCEAYLTVNKEYQTKKVYPQKATPFAIRKKLNLPTRDDGWDGVYETIDGSYATYQAKFRTKDEKLLWQGDNGLSSTIAKGQRADIIHLITTVNKIPSSFTNSDKVLQTLGNSLENIDKRYFLKIENWLKNKKFTKEGIHYPEPYQKEALHKIKEELKTNNRATVIMACGAGKTDIGVWEYLRRKPKLSLVLVPSIALIKQIRADWLSQIQENVMTFQICSSKDTTKREDAIIIKEKDLDFKISTDKNELKYWLQKKIEIPKIIFSTYQSSPVMNEVMKKYVIDFAVFDEAHRTATVNRNSDSYFSNALFDENIKIKKRLFMTATRRIGSKTMRHKEGDEKLNINMDNHELYGNVCHSLSFTKAAKTHKCIAQLKIIVSEIFSDEVDNARTRISATHIEGEKLKSDYLAVLLAIKKAQEKYKINKVFTFNPSIPQAEEFSISDGPLGINFYLKNFYTNFISGKMNMNTRDDIMLEFKSSNKALLANKRCLVEGIDVPSVNMVVFNSPKSSEVDIVQSIGRALRNRGQKNKKFGYVLVPIFIEKNKNESHSDAIKRTKFEKVTEIINALKFHDDEIAQIINKMILQKIRGKGRNIGGSLGDFIEGNHPEISKKLLIESISADIVDRLKTEWDEKIVGIIKFKEKYGHTNLYKEKKTDKKLIKFIADVRRRWKKNKLLNFQIKQLEEIGIKKYRDEVTLFDTKGYVYMKQLMQKLEVGPEPIKQLIKKRLIVSVGTGDSPVGISEYFKDISKEDFMKLAKIDVINTKNLYTARQIAKKLNYTSKKLIEYFEKKKIKPIIGIGNNSLNTSYYKMVDKNDFQKVMKVTLDCKTVKKFQTITMLDKQLNKELKCKKYKSYYKYLKDRKKIFHSGTYFSNRGGVTKYYKKLSNKEIMKLLGITLLNPEGLLIYSKFADSFNITRDLIEKLIKLKYISPVGTSFSNTINQISYFFKPMKKADFCKLCGIDFIDRKNKFPLSSLSKKYSISPGHLKRILIKCNIKPLGKSFSRQSKSVDKKNPLGLSDYYDDLNINYIKKQLKVDFIGKEVNNFYSLNKLALFIKKRYTNDIGLNKLKEFIRNNIKPVGKGYVNQTNPIYLYEKISKKDLLELL